jgi:uncharacterized repeat protein (TIGR01451 family)
MEKQMRPRLVQNLFILVALFSLVAFVPPFQGEAASSPETEPSAPVPSRWTCSPPIVDGAAPHHEWGTAPTLPLEHGRIYLLNDGEYLYVLMDVVGDTQFDAPLPADPWGDYFWLTFDVDRDGKISPEIDVNYAVNPFVPPDTLWRQWYLGPRAWTGLIPSAGSMQTQMGPSFAAPGEHHIWEMAIPLAEIDASPGSVVRAGFRAFSQNPSFADDLPPNFYNDFAGLIEVQLAEERCDLELVKTVTPDVAEPGDILNYRIHYQLGGQPHSNVTIHDALPPGVTYLPGSANPPAVYGGGVLTWHLGDLPPGASGSVEFQVLVAREACRGQQMVADFASLAADVPFIHQLTGPAVTEIICRPVEFPTDDPPYAESEITVNPYPLVVGQATHVCTTIANTSDQPETVLVEFSLANFGIGLPFTPIPAASNPREVVIPPHGSVTVCIVWIPTTPGHQCLQVRVIDVNQQFPEMRSQRNLDVSEVLKPGEPALFGVPVQNNTPDPLQVGMVVRNNCPGWGVVVKPVSFLLSPGGIEMVQVTVTPPPDAVLGSGCTIDIEAWAMDQAGNRLWLIGGIRKIDDPLIPLGDPGERPFAEREIRVFPYPLVSGQPARVCVMLDNNTDSDQMVTVEFMLSGFGIGLAYNRIDPIAGANPRTLVIPAHSTVDVCIRFLPSAPGHHCLAVKLSMPNGYVTWSRKNLDVAELLKPEVPTEVPIAVGNPTPVVANIDLVVDNTCPGWAAWVAPVTLWGVGPNSTDIRTAILTVIPPPGLLGSNCHIDLLAYIDGRLIGGIRKIDRPPAAPPIDEPHWAEREITVFPDPPLVGQLAQLCVKLANPTPVDQTVDVTFAVADFGAGIGFTNVRTVPDVFIPANAMVMECIVWVPGTGGTLHRCVRVQIQQDGYRDVFSQRNINLVRLPLSRLRVPNGQIDLPPFLLHNPGTDPMPFFFDVRPVGLAGLLVQLIDQQTGGVVPPAGEVVLSPGEVRAFFLRLMSPAGRAPAPEFAGDDQYIDVLPHGNGQLIVMDGLVSGVRFVFAPPEVYLPIVLRNF